MWCNTIPGGFATGFCTVVAPLPDLLRAKVKYVRASLYQQTFIFLSCKLMAVVSELGQCSYKMLFISSFQVPVAERDGSHTREVEMMAFILTFL